MTIPILHHTFDPTGISLTYDSGWVVLSLVIAAIVTVSSFVPIVEKIGKTLKKNPPQSVVKFVSCTLLGIAALVVALAVVGLLEFSFHCISPTKPTPHFSPDPWSLLKI